MDFRSDNVTGACEAVLRALTAANADSVASYGDDPWTDRARALIGELFETDCAVLPVATGTAANAVALGATVPPHGAVYCHREAHVNVDECGAPEMFTGGAKLVALDGAAAKLAPEAIETALAQGWRGVVHHVQPAAVSITQASECGTVYTPAEVAALGDLCRRHDLLLHMDGARFANAVARTGARPADLTWKAGVDILSFGATKNGAFAAEAIVAFRPGLAQRLGFARKRGGHLLSKMRFVSAQLVGYLEDGVWLDNARHANAMADRLAEGLAAVPGAAPAYPVEANEVFVRLDPPVAEAMRRAGALFHPWVPGGPNCWRLVTAWNTAPEAVDAVMRAARAAA